MANERIWVIDDDRSIRWVLERALDQAGLTAASFESATPALARLENEQPDVIITDVRMPGPDGMEVLRTIKKRWPDCEVVVITGYPTIESAKEAVRLGAQNYIVKPVGPDDVIQAANEAMNQKRWALHSEHRVNH